MARNRNRGEAATAEAPKGDEAELSTAEGSEVAGTVETTDAPTVEGENVGGFEPPKGDEAELPPSAPHPAPIEPPNHDGDEPLPRLRQLTHEEETKAEQAFRLAVRMAKLEGLDEPTTDDIAKLRRDIATDIIRNPARVDEYIVEMRSKLPKLPVRTYRVWAGGEFHHDGKVFKPGAELQFPSELAENYAGILELVDEE